MFTGTLPPEARLVLQVMMSHVQCKDTYVACSGNYNIDKLMSAMGYRVHSNDVSLYSKLIADIVLGMDTTPLTCTDEEMNVLFSQWEKHPYKKLAMVMYVMAISGFLPRKNLYQEEMCQAYIEQHKTFYKSTIKKLSKGALDFKIADFYYGDFVDFLKTKRGTGGIGIAFPPTYKGGYEKMYAKVEEIFEYERAQYEIFDPKTACEVFRELLETDRNIIMVDEEKPELNDFLTAKIRIGNGKHPIYAYSSIEKESRKYYIEKAGKSLTTKYAIVPPDYEFTENTKISCEIVSKEDVNYWKDFFMATKVNYTLGGDLAMIFFADGKAFGFISFSLRNSTESDDNSLYSLADFVVTSNTTKRLSKLLIMLEISHDVQLLIARRTSEWFERVKTHVWTQSPVSMKYRGVFKLTRRDPGKLTYMGEFGDESIKDIYKKWLTKHNK